MSMCNKIETKTPASQSTTTTLSDCLALESKRLESDSITNSFVYANAGYLITCQMDILLRLCLSPLTRFVCCPPLDRVDQRFDVYRFERVDGVRKNLILTNGFQLSYWKSTLAAWEKLVHSEIDSDEFILVNSRRLLTVSNVHKYRTLIIPVGMVTKPDDVLKYLGNVQFGRVLYHNVQSPPSVHKMDIQCAFKWFVTSDRSDATNLPVSFVVHDPHCKVAENLCSRTVISSKPIESVTLQGLVERIITDSIDTYDIKRVIKHLASPDIKSERDVIRLVLRRLTNEMHMVDENEISINRMEYASEDDRSARLELLESSRVSIRRRKEELVRRMTSHNICFICYSPIEVKAVMKCCANVVCLECIKKWLHHRNTCPLCKAEGGKLYIVNEEEVKNTQAEVEGQGPANRLSVNNNIFTNFKLLIVDILTKGRDNNAQVVVVGSEGPVLLNRFFDIVRIELGVRCAHVKGNHIVIAKLLASFEGGDTKVLFVDQRNILYPITLTRATDVVYILEGTRPTWDVLPRLKRKWVLTYGSVFPNGTEPIECSTDLCAADAP